MNQESPQRLNYARRDEHAGIDRALGVVIKVVLWMGLAFVILLLLFFLLPWHGS